MEQGTFCWYECGTRDVEAAKRFYCDLFGWTTAEQPMPGEAGGVYTMFRNAGRDVGGLYEMAGPQFEGVPPHWATYVWVDDVDQSVAKVGGLGGEVLMDAFDIPDVGRMAVVKDPQGAVIHLFKSAKTPVGEGCDDASAFAPGSFCWSELTTTDKDAAKAFYGSLIGWAMKDQDVVPGMPYTELGVGERSVGGMMSMQGDQWQGIPPHWMNYVSVADVDAIAAKAAELGGEVAVPPTDIPNVGRFSVLRDPTGAALSVIALPKS